MAVVWLLSGRLKVGGMSVTDTVIVRFEDDGSGVAELSWGQHTGLVGDTGEGGTGAVPAMDAVR
jgi:hypothetical protein